MKDSLNFIDTKRITWAIFITILLVAMRPNPVSANVVYELKVVYTGGENTTETPNSCETPPDSVTAIFSLGAGEIITEPVHGEDVTVNKISFDRDDVTFVSIVFGDTTWTSAVMEDFSMLSSVDLSTVEPLSYTLDVHGGPIVINFPLKISGVEDFSGDVCSYGYNELTKILTPVEQAVTVAIDIKPGSDTNCFNANGHGVIPVAVMGSEGFEVSQIDLASLAFGGLAVRVRGNKGPMCSLEYSNEDAYIDLLCHFEDDALNWAPGDGEAMLTGNLMEGTTFEGADSICVVP